LVFILTIHLVYLTMPGSDDDSFAAHIMRFVLMVSLALAIFSRFSSDLNLNGYVNYSKRLLISTVRSLRSKPGLTLTLSSLVFFSKVLALA